MTAFTQDSYKLRMQIITVSFPTRDTTAIAFGDVMFELAQHPEASKEHRAEVLTLDQPLTFEMSVDLCGSHTGGINHSSTTSACTQPRTRV